MDTAGVVDLIERGLDAELHLDPKLFGRAGECCRDSKPNLVIGHPADGRGALGCTANGCDSCQILAVGSLCRRNGRLSGCKARLFPGYFRVPRRLQRNSRVICTKAQYLIQFGRKLACGEQRDCRSYRRGNDETTHGGEPPDSPWSSRRVSLELRIQKTRHAGLLVTFREFALGARAPSPASKLCSRE